MHKIIGLLLALFWAGSAAAHHLDGGTGMQISAGVDMTGDFAATPGSRSNDYFGVREAEIGIGGPIDQTFTGTLSAAAHRENGETKFEIHEAHIDTANLVPRSTIRVGQYFLGIGRLNRSHRHEWPFIFPPRVQAELFGQEGVLDDGVEYGWIAPTPFVLNVTAGVTNGWSFGEAGGPLDSGVPTSTTGSATDPSGASGAEPPRKPDQPTHYARISTFTNMPGKGGAEIGVSGLGRTDADGVAGTYLGLDFAAKWREGGFLHLLLQAEAWQRTLRPKSGDAVKSIGAYLFPQYGVTEQVSAGILFDHYTTRALRARRAVPTVTYKASEFSTLRAAYDWSVDEPDGRASATSRRYEVQAVFALGAHPAHDY